MLCDLDFDPYSATWFIRHTHVYPLKVSMKCFSCSTHGNSNVSQSSGSDSERLSTVNNPLQVRRAARDAWKTSIVLPAPAGAVVTALSRSRLLRLQ